MAHSGEGRFSPPSWVTRFLGWALGPGASREVLGDLEELARDRRPRAVAVWYGWQAWALVVRDRLWRRRASAQAVRARRAGGWIADVRFAARSYRRTPVLAAAILLTLALGVGANTAIFSVVDAVLLRPLPFPEADRLVVVYQTEPTTARLQPFSPPDLVDFTVSISTLDPMAGWVYERYALTGDGDPEQILAVRVTDGFFDVLGAAAALGRTFDVSAEDDRRTVVLSHAFWTRRFGADPAVLGRTILLDHEPYAVVGVMPIRFRFPDQDDVAIWIPQVWYGWEQIRHTRNTSVIARLAPRATPSQARQELTAVAARLSEAYPETNGGVGATLESAEVLAGGGGVLVILMAAVGLVLLIACANVANLLLARASDRDQELAVRRSLGASQGRILRQLLVESGLLAVVGSGLGVLLALLGTRALLALEPGALPAWNDVSMNRRVLLFAVGLAALITTVAGLLPALRASRRSVTAGLRAGGQSPGVRDGARTRSALSVVEVALAVVLLSGAGLLVSSMLALVDVDPGFQPDGLVTATIELPETKYQYGTGAMEETFQSIIEEVRGVPGVIDAGMVTTLPMNPVGTDYDVEFYLVEDPNRTPGDAPPHADFRVASGGYFDAMRIPLLQGRPIQDSDRADTRPVAVVNRTLAERFFPGEDPLGRHVQVYSPDGPGFEIVGVVGNVRHRGLDDVSRPELYVPYRQMTHGEMTLAVRAELGTGLLVGALKEAVARVDGDLPLIAVREASTLLADSVAERRFTMVLLVSFAGLGLVLAVVGVYGTLSYSVSRRRREIGVRMAIGAGRPAVQRLVVLEGLRLVASGVVLGLVGTALATGALRSLLFGVGPGDPPTLAAVIGLVAAVALVACWLPAARASRVEPTQALREG